MIPFIVAGLALVGAGTAVYKYFSDDDTPIKEVKPTSLGMVALWGVPNSGKTTFVKRLLKHTLGGESVQTSSMQLHTDVEITSNGREYVIEKIYDMPGVESRKQTWLEQVGDARTSIYLINLQDYFDPSKKSNYQQKVKQHLKELKEVLSKKAEVNLVIIGTHLDVTEFNGLDKVNNLVQESADFELIMAPFQDLKMKFYSVNLFCDSSYESLIKDVVGDIDARP